PRLHQVSALLRALNTFVEAVDDASTVKAGGDSDAPFWGATQRRLRMRARERLVPNGSIETGIVVSRISMNSPLTVELATTALTSAGLVSAVVYLFKNPDKLGGWFPKLQTSWYDGLAEREKAKAALEELRKAKTEMRELEP
ncbi:hypothetical protein, partial [Acrocarpospora pleiomorpha]